MDPHTPAAVGAADCFLEHGAADGARQRGFGRFKTTASSCSCTKADWRNETRSSSQVPGAHKVLIHRFEGPLQNVRRHPREKERVIGQQRCCFTRPSHMFGPVHLFLGPLPCYCRNTFRNFSNMPDKLPRFHHAPETLKQPKHGNTDIRDPPEREVSGQRPLHTNTLTPCEGDHEPRYLAGGAQSANGRV